MQGTPEHAIEQAYRRYFAAISKKCARMLGDSQEATDVAQETFVRLWEHRGTLRDPLAITAWIYRTSTRLAIARFRRLAHTADRGETPSEILTASDDPELGAHVRRLLVRVSHELSEREIEVAVLSRLDGLTQTEIAEVLACSERTVRRLLARVDDCARRMSEDAAP